MTHLGIGSEFSIWKINNESENRIILFSAMSLICRLVDSLFQGNCARGDIYDNNDYLQIECFKFCFFPLIQKELDDVKD